MAGRPRQFDRQQALDTAVEQFWRRGYEQTTVATLTDAMGITAPSLYAAFGDKDRLFAEAAGCYAARTEAGICRALDQPTVGEAVAELMRVTAAAHTDPATPHGCFILTEARLADRRADLRQLISARIARGQIEGDVSAETDPDAVADYLLAVMAGMSARARDGATAEQVEAIGALARRNLSL